MFVAQCKNNVKFICGDLEPMMHKDARFIWPDLYLFTHIYIWGTLCEIINIYILFFGNIQVITCTQFLYRL